MKNALLCAALGTFAAACVLPAMAADHRLAFDGGIGSQPFASVGGVVAANDVRGIAPGGRPWVIGKLRAVVRQDGAITVKGSGLLLAGGNAVGLPALPRQVAATLICGTTEFTSAPTNLDARGDFEIRDTLAGVPTSSCVTPILLIRNFGSNGAGPWFAAGIRED